MKIQRKKMKWKIAGIWAIAGMILFGTPVLADDSSITYPVKRVVIGVVMSVTLPLEKMGGGEIMVSEKIYQVSSRTVMVDQAEKKTPLDYFKRGDWVYMIVDLYRDHKEALFIGPSSNPSTESDQNP